MTQSTSAATAGATRDVTTRQSHEFWGKAEGPSAACNAVSGGPLPGPWNRLCPVDSRAARDGAGGRRDALFLPDGVTVATMAHRAAWWTPLNALAPPPIFDVIATSSAQAAVSSHATHQTAHFLVGAARRERGTARPPRATSGRRWR